MFHRNSVVTPHIVVSAFVATLLLTASASAQGVLTGNWSGTYTSSIQVNGCSNQTFTSSGNVAVTFLQTGSTLVGRMDRTNVLVFSGNCSPVKQEITHSVLGTVTGSSVSWWFPNNMGGTQFDGTFDGSSLTAQLSNASGGSGTLTLSRTPADAPAADATGSWSGNYNFTDRCSNGATQVYAGALTLGLAQSGNSAEGVLTMQNVPLYDQSCRKITSLNMSMATAGVVSGSTFTGSVFDPSGSFEFPITATIANGAMSGTVTGANGTSTTGTFTLSQSSSTPPASDNAGSYQGTYSEVDNDSLFCSNVGRLAFSGAASLSIVQSGNAISVALLFEDALDVASDGFGGCAIVDAGEVALPLYGILTGNTLTATIPIGSVSGLFTVMFNGDGSLSGTLSDPYGDTASFNATRTASALPAITRFQAAPASIVSGQSATLSWSVLNATSVSIDNGIGTEPVSGSATVSPAQTTTYTLKAIGQAGSATSTTTVTVFPAGPRRRAVHP